MNVPLSRQELARVRQQNANRQKQLKALTEKRDLLFSQFSKHPAQTHLALEIKLIDDQVAECREQLRREGNERR
jgi:vacuolar-type H+-ATPase subunit D/Vma8